MTTTRVFADYLPPNLVEEATKIAADRLRARGATDVEIYTLPEGSVVVTGTVDRLKRTTVIHPYRAPEWQWIGWSRCWSRIGGASGPSLPAAGIFREM
jgi:hypothetical protein